ncbi:MULTISPECIES: YheC/YheD family endospore coat-associated protein [unclassified Paenibacillus]|uniref:YheC/YheD family endospore coat-associated protein n=1 Tax=unclassified Paenibacillus TaxID=185978 RepID=UPI002F42EC54
MAPPVLGILTLYLNEGRALEERPIYEKMTIAGQQLGLQVFVFTPQDVNYSKNRIHALFFNPKNKTWKRKWTSLPHAIYDRCRLQKSHRFQQLLKFRSHYRHLKFLNKPLRNKWTVHTTLNKDEQFKPYLPVTKYVSSTSDVTNMLRKFSIVYMKPISGTGGRGILRIERLKSGLYYVQGRDQQRKIIRPRRVTLAALITFISSWNLKSTRYIAQQGIQLKLDNGRVHDYRMLVQKNDEGKWQITGCAGRVGAQGSITSNLHGGGKAVPMEKLLREWINDESSISSIKEEAERFGVDAAQFLEKSYGSLCELAFDIAIDRNGHIWMIEVNPKPAREVFIQAGETEVYQKAITNPLKYALWCIKK